MRYVIGVDEVGRGSLAGPVTVCAALVPARATFRWAGAPSLLRDSKQLSPRKREAWIRYFRARLDSAQRKHRTVAWAVASESARTVDRIGIRDAANRAATRALSALGEQVQNIITHSKIQRRNLCMEGVALVLDAGLAVPPAMVRKLGVRSVACFPKADERVPAVAVASIIAKVHRDAYMRRLHGRFPAYGFGAHKGYGTKAHRAAIHRRGPSPMHRLTFCGLGLRRLAGATKP
ncbi:MAG: ribonuclease HII [bacterium]|nr:ribonuclease HII [bacterium]